MVVMVPMVMEAVQQATAFLTSSEATCQPFRHWIPSQNSRTLNDNNNFHFLSEGAGRMNSEPYDVLIVGAGFSGLGLAAKLLQSGTRRLLVVDKQAQVGGTWAINTYPGCACDVPSHLYSFSFAPNPNWSRAFSPGPEILQYLQKTASDFGVEPYLRLNTDFIGGVWDEMEAVWIVTLSSGEVRTRLLVTAVGGLSAARQPTFEGQSEFLGHCFHTQRWNHQLSMTGKRVAVIGTGASAIQVVPEVAKVAAHLTVFQRTPVWVLPRNDAPISPQVQRLLRRLPPLLWLWRFVLYWVLEAGFLGFSAVPRLRARTEKMARAHLEKQVPEPTLREKLIPDYAPGCKRLLISDDYFPTLCLKHVALETVGIKRFTPTGLLLSDGREIAVDVVVWATGFSSFESVNRLNLVGRGGQRLSDAWATGLSAYKGAALSGFPNLFFMTGPNTGIGHTSLVFMAECQMAYVVDALAKIKRQRLRSVEVRLDVVKEYTEKIDRLSAKTVWLSGCKSWYLDGRGRNRSLWPDFTFRFRRATQRFDLESYDTEALA
jgi:cation diffusion facilitator CzcD-associated flavoprotein CzcO